MTIKGEEHYTDHLNNGFRALESGDWKTSLVQFQSGAKHRDTPEAREGLGMAAWWLDDVSLTFDSHERAFRLYRDRDDARGAARMATWLALDHYLFRNDLAIATGWFQRAHRLLEGIAPSAEHGWLALWEGHVAIFERNDVVTAKRLSSETTKLAAELGDFDLEMLALALEGLARVGQGDVDEGMRLLDESTTAAVSGEMHNPDAIVTACCFLIFACERVRDYDRAAQWCKKVEEVARRWSYGSMFAFCRTHYAAVLIWRGDWEQAERELLRASDDLAIPRPGWSAESALRLGELRLREGRYDEALECFERLPGHPLAILGKAELALNDNRLEAALDLIERFFRRVPATDRTERASALEFAVRLHLALDDIPSAAKHVTELDQVAGQIGTGPVIGSVNQARGLVALAGGDFDEARRYFEDAFDVLASIGAPYEMARARELLARALFQMKREKPALAEGEAALETFNTLGARADSERLTTFLGEIEKTACAGSELLSQLSPREVEVIKLLAGGQSNQEIAARLFISVRTVERHISTIYEKIGASGSTARAAATAHAFEQGLIPRDGPTA